MRLTKSILKQTYAEDNGVGGNVNKAWLAKIGTGSGELSSFTASNGRVTAMTFGGSVNGLIEMYTREDGITAPSDTPQTERGAGRVKTETINAIVKKLGVDAAEAVNDILKCNGYVLFYVTNQKEIKVRGIFDRLDTAFTIGKGLRPSLTETEDAAFADEASRTLTFVGETVEFGGLFYGTGVLATDIAALDALVYEESASS
jgi:hypothetical protein